MFCGRYVTPVADGYLEHLDCVRGRGGGVEMRDGDGARGALRANGGVLGKEVNGSGGEGMGMGMMVVGEGEGEGEGERAIMTEQMDIGLPNIGDYAGR